MKFPISQLDFDRDFASFADLNLAIYGAKAVTDESVYRWLFLHNHYNPGGRHFLNVAKDGAKVVASDCLLPVPLRILGKNYLAAWSIKTMTHPDYQRQGIFRAMTEFNISQAKAAGIDIILGFANANSFPGYEKFGWDVLVERRAVIRPLDIRSTLAKRKILLPMAGIANAVYKVYDRRRINGLREKAGMYATDMASKLPKSGKDIWPRLQSGFPILVAREGEYLEWRYNQRPRQDYKYIIARGREKTESLLIIRTSAATKSCIIIDYVGPSQSDTMAALIFKTMRYCQDSKLRYIINSSGSVFDSLLTENFGFKYLSAPLANNMFIACRLNDSIDLEALKKETNWFYSYGDSELDIDLQPG